MGSDLLHGCRWNRGYGASEAGGEVEGSIPGTCYGYWREMPLNWRGAQGSRVRALGERRSKLGVRCQGA